MWRTADEIPVSAHRPAPGSAQGQRTCAGRDRVIRRAAHGPHRLRRPAVQLPRTARLQPVQARQRHVHRRAGSASSRHGSHCYFRSPWRGAPNFGSEDQAWFFAGISRLVRPFLKTPAQGAQTPIYLASSPDVEGLTGGFYANGKPRTPNQIAGDPAMTARLWQVSSDLVA
jgi:hypothetical protein